MLHQIIFVKRSSQLRVLLQHFPNSLHHIPAPAVISRDGKCKSIVPGCKRLAIANKFDYFLIKFRQVADHFEANAVLVQFGNLLLEHADEKLHQECDLVRRPAPIFATESE